MYNYTRITNSKVFVARRKPY